MKTKILYIHGYGSKGNSTTARELEKCMNGEAIVYSPAFSNNLNLFSEMERNIEQARAFVRENAIKLVVASSMGAFTALNLTSIPKLVINPCMLPSEQLPLLIDPNIAPEEIEKYRLLEQSRIIDREECLITYGLFATNDELFSYRDLFEKQYLSDNAYSMNDGHRISADNVKNSLTPLIHTFLADLKVTEEYFANFSPCVIPEMNDKDWKM